MTATERRGEGKPRETIDANPVWYHSIEVAPGVVTPGQIDLREVAPRILPNDLAGKRALDVGTFDGFWAFEMERRGAEVVATDVDKIDAADWPPLSRDRLQREADEMDLELGRGFAIASGLLGSKVVRVVCSVYDLEPAAIGGPVDVAFVGAILLHLRDPIGALERVASTVKPGGEVRIFEPFSLWLSITHRRRPVAEFRAHATAFNWWVSNLANLRTWLIAAGLTNVRRLAMTRPPSSQAMKQMHAGLSARVPG